MIPENTCLIDTYETETVDFSANASNRGEVMPEYVYPPLEVILETWLSPKEAVELRGDITESGIRDLCQRGTLIAKLIGGRWYINPESVKTYVRRYRGGRPKE